MEKISDALPRLPHLPSSSSDQDETMGLAPSNFHLPEVQEVTPRQAFHIEEEVAEHHLADPNYWVTDHVHISKERDEKAEDGSASSERVVVEVENDQEEDSPYPEVRAAVSNTDDPTMPVNTFRMWFLGIVFTVVISGLNQFFGFRYPSVTITSLVAQLVALPLGKILEKILPTREFTTLGCRWTLNPGPFNIKEHTLITVMANVVYGGAYATDILAVQKSFYNQSLDTGYQLLLVISTQLIGFSYAGLCRRFLVWPGAMIWPYTLVNSALFNALHQSYEKSSDGWMSRNKFFAIAFTCSAVWYWFPGYIFTALSVFSWVCWIAPNNFVVNSLFGYQTGLGMGFVTFDWSQIAYTGSPLVTPWWAQANVFACLVIIYWIAAPIMYYKNVFFAQYLPMSSSGSYDNTGAAYNATAIIVDGIFDPELYANYSPLYLSMTFALAYGLSFGALTSTLVHVFLWYRHDIARQFRASLKDEPDIHSRLMTAYREVPNWWYIGLFLGSFAIAIVTIEVWKTQLPVWALILALLISLVYLIPIGMIQAITNQQVGLNVITELIIGYALPGKPVAMMIFKTFGYITMAQGLAFVGDLKLGHYMKIPPRMMFMAQVVAALVACFVVVGVQDWMFGNIEGMCQPGQTDNFTCPGIKVFGTASLIWGGIGPTRIFTNGLYKPLLWFFLIGALLPIPFYYLAKRYPMSGFKYVNIPVFFTGTGLMPPATGINFSSWFMVGITFMYFVRRYHFAWWSHYNYVLSAAMDSGVAITTIIIFFCLYYPNGGVQLNWWGNSVYTTTMDGMGASYRAIPQGEVFGYQPGTWS
ncbi:OPT oligopeptide transporter [Calocera viscosa TUFC12733]|uniref:OPT oligopeptide transporter n=1 Tax=Calocera viscosa (strain TUFC12733) TaxID=1330018 RepID=A0A167GDE3_CALVF|nr:OPT oligopeptide transporter [Calocera viscosa TUFC12733]